MVVLALDIIYQCMRINDVDALLIHSVCLISSFFFYHTFYSYVARVDENALQGTALVFSEPYISRVYDDDTGKNGVFSLTLLGNNGTFEISPNVAERRANFIIYVRDNHLLDFETRQSVQFQVNSQLSTFIYNIYSVLFFFMKLISKIFIQQILAQELGPATNLSAIVNVTVYINDINDNSPVFDQEMYVVDVPENATAGTKVAQVRFSYSNSSSSYIS